MDSALALTGFYFTIIGFISGLFFTRLDSWYGEARKFSASVKLMQTIEEFKRARQEMAGIRSSAPLGSFIAIGVFTSSLLVLALLVPITDAQVDPLLFLRLPLILTVCAYWAGGIWLLLSARKLLASAQAHIEKVFKKTS